MIENATAREVVQASIAAQQELDAVPVDVRALGRGFRLITNVSLPRSIDEVFAFFADAYNLDLLTPRWLRFRILTPPPVTMRRGLLLDYRLELRGLPVRWQSEITEWDPPHRFVDEQRAGPYRRWVHEHAFRAAGTGTDVMDRVDYAVPGGRLVHRLFVKGSLNEIFQYRQRKLMELFALRPATVESFESATAGRTA